MRGASLCAISPYLPTSPAQPPTPTQHDLVITPPSVRDGSATAALEAEEEEDDEEGEEGEGEDAMEA